ncbi:MAG: hypothetical protein WA885_11530 [Phormidesmis sp.]
MAKKTALVFAANARNTQYLSLRPEIDKIKAIVGSRNVQVYWDTTTDDLYDNLTADRLPQIVHFCGHGEPDGLIFVSGHGKAHKVHASALSKLFASARDRGVQCVFLNTCYSEQLADAISQHVDFVIGMECAIPDSLAVKFSGAFYQAVVKGNSYAQSYHAGCDRIALDSMQGSTIPKIKFRRSHHVAEDITAIQLLWLQATSTVDLQRLLQRLATLRQQYPSYPKAKKLEAQIRRTASVTRNLKGMLFSLRMTDAFSVSVLSLWIFLGIVFAKFFYARSGEVEILICLQMLGGYASQMLYSLAWHSLRPVGYWQQVLLKSFLPNALETIGRISLSSSIGLFLVNLVLPALADSSFADSDYLSGLIIGSVTGMVMVVLMLWQLSLSPTRRQSS